jgi:hypothetical protein
MYLPTQNWQIPVTPASTLNTVAAESSEPSTGTLQGAAEYATLRVIYGRVRVTAQIANVVDYQGNWVIQVIWGEGLIQGIESVTFDDKAPTGTVVHYQGTSGQLVNATLVAAFAVKGITYADTLPNIAYSVFTIPSATATTMPQIAAVIQGRLLYDPRTSNTVFSENPALVLADFATNTVYGMGRSIDYASVIVAANACDSLVGGLPRRTIGLTIDSPQAVETWLDTLSTYAGCWAMVEGANVVLVADRPASSVRSFLHASGDILGLKNLRRRGIAGLPTAIEIRYTDTTIVPWRSLSVWAYLPGVQAGTFPRRESQISLPGITRASQASREAIERLNKLTLADLSCQLEVFDEALALQPGDVVTVTHPIGLTAKAFRVQNVQSTQGRHNLDLLEYDAAVYSDSVIATPSTPDTTLPSPLAAIGAVTGLASSEEIFKAGDGTIASRLRITWNTITDLWAIQYSIKLTRMDTAGGLNSIQVDLGSSNVGLYVTGPLEDEYYYKIEVTANRTAYSVVSTVATLTVQALGKLLPPADVTGLTSTITPAGLVLNWTPVVDIDFDGYRVKQTLWSNGVIQTVATTNVNLGYTAVGSQTYLVRAFDRSGNESANNASTTIVVNAVSAVSGLAGSVATGDLVLTWLAATASWPIAFYEVRYGGSAWGVGDTLADKVNTTRYLGAVGYTGARTWRVRAVDMAGNYGTEATVVVTVTVHTAPATFTSQFVDLDAELNWATTSGSLPLKHYEVRFGASWAAGTTAALVSANTMRQPVAWLTRQYWIAAIDIDGNAGTATSNTTLTVTLPPAPASFTGQFAASDAQLTWTPVTSSLPVKYYDIRYGTSWAAGTSVAQITGTTFRQAVAWASRQYWIAAVDFNGNVGAATANVTLTVAAYAAVTPSYAVSQADIVLSWTTATGGSLPLAFYEVRFGAVFSSATVVAKVSTTTLTTAAVWTGNRTYWVVPVDLLGNYGTEASVITTINIPGAVSPSTAFIASKVSLSWSAASASLPIASYQIRTGASWAAGTLVVNTSATDYRVNITWLGARTFWIAAYDVAGNEGTPASTVATVVAPAAPTVSRTFTLDTLILTWTTPSATVPLRDYEVRYGASFAAGISLGKVLGTQFSLPVTWGGSRLFWVAATDDLGNLGANGGVDAAVAVPTAPTITSQVVDNNVLLYWSGSTGTLPVSSYQLRRGATWAGASVIGLISGGFTTVFETLAGTYTYWVCGIDTAGNYGTPASVAVYVSSPPDYVLNVKWNSTFAGTLSNIAVDTDGSRLMGADLTETWTTHFTSRGWTTPQDQITAGSPIYAQPGLLPSYYEEVNDYGTSLAATKITVTQNGSNVSGSPVLTCNISTSNTSNTGPWTDFVGVWSVYATLFRWVKVRVTLTGGQYDLTQLTTTLDSKLKNDSGTVACLSTDVGGTVVNFAASFVDVSAIAVTPNSTTMTIAIYDFVDAPNPTSFKVLLFNQAGARVSGNASWTARGY